ncbi:MAG: hypothetical protein ACRD15_09670 [Vicinamibacterales bacterium]
MRAVIYLWIELADAQAVPAALRHRLELEILRQSGPVRTVVEDLATKMSRSGAAPVSPIQLSFETGANARAAEV